MVSSENDRRSNFNKRKFRNNWNVLLEENNMSDFLETPLIGLIDTSDDLEEEIEMIFDIRYEENIYGRINIQCMERI